MEEMTGKRGKAYLWFNFYFGAVAKRVEVIGETPKRYRVKLLEEVCGRGWKAGDVRLVPKHAVEFGSQMRT